MCFRKPFWSFDLRHDNADKESCAPASESGDNALMALSHDLADRSHSFPALVVHAVAIMAANESQAASPVSVPLRTHLT
jgi:hypothetical protein